MKKIGYALLMLLSFFAGMLASRHAAFEKIAWNADMASRYMCLLKFACRWLALKQRGMDTAAYLMDKGYRSIAIYGMGDLGERFADEVLNTDVSVAYAIDRTRKESYSGIKIKGINETLPRVDAVIVTAVYDFWEIKPILMDKFKCPIISLEDVIGV